MDGCFKFLIFILVWLAGLLLFIHFIVTYGG